MDFSILKKIILDYIFVILVLAFVFILTRLLEFLFIRLTGNSDISLIFLVSRSIKYDLLFLLLFSFVFLIPVLVSGFISLETAGIFSRILALLLIIIHLSLTLFFLISGNILNSVIFEFSFQELIKIIFTEFSSQNTFLWISFLLTLASSFYILFYFKPKINFKSKIEIFLISVYFIFVILAVFNINHVYKSIKYFDNNYQFLTGNSKEVFFLRSVKLKKETINFNLQEVRRITKSYQNSNKSFKYCNPEYPFMHNEPYQNVLGKYFNTDTLKPNIVIIISESLSSSFSGKQNCIGGSLTPFIDSLSSQSLYWESFFSNAERSYGALPNILASLPAGTIERGFINMDYEYPGFRKYPLHTSLIKLLKENNYQSSYFYGGWGDYDNVGQFIKENEIDYCITENDFDTTRYYKAKGKMVWGYNDKDLFAQAFDFMEDYDTNVSYLNIYQTLSLHSPFNLCEEKYFTKGFIEKRIKKLNQKHENLKKLPDKKLSTIFFADDAMQFFFNEYKKRKDFSKTIFIITGDHSIDYPLNKNIFEKFRIPLIIYSPLLYKPAVFKGVCSHIDILPSIIGLLQNNFGLNFPLAKHWIGAGLDTSRFFNAERNFPLKLKSQEYPNYIAESDAIYDDKVIHFDSLLNVSPEQDERKIKKVRDLYENYSFLNNYVCIRNMIWNVRGNQCDTLK